MEAFPFGWLFFQEMARVGFYPGFDACPGHSSTTRIWGRSRYFKRSIRPRVLSCWTRDRILRIGPRRSNQMGKWPARFPASSIDERTIAMAEFYLGDLHSDPDDWRLIALDQDADAGEIARQIVSRLAQGDSEKEAIERISRKHEWPGPDRDSLVSALTRELLQCSAEASGKQPRRKEGPERNEPADKSTSTDLTRVTQGD